MEHTEPKVIIKYSSYTPAQKKATQKYRQNNKDKVNEQRKKYYQERKEKDISFLEYKREKAREYYQRKKLLKEADPDFIDEPAPIVEEVKEEVIEVPVIEEAPFIEPPKRKRAPKKSIVEYAIEHPNKIDEVTVLESIFDTTFSKVEETKEEEVKEKPKKTKKVKSKQL